jgi:hypothetical protein
MSMTTHHSPEAEASAKAAMHLAAAVHLAEVALRIRQDLARRDTSRAKAELAARHAADRVAWARATDRQWLASAALPDLAKSWRAAAVWAERDPAAARSTAALEEQLRERMPGPMAVYDSHRQAGQDRVTAMRQAMDAAAPAAEAGHRLDRDSRGRRTTNGGTVAADLAAQSVPARRRATSATLPHPATETPGRILGRDDQLIRSR